MSNAGGRSVPKQVIRNAGTPATSGYTELDSALNGDTKAITIMSSYDQDVALALGASGSEVDILYVHKGSVAPIVLDFPIVLSAGQRLSVKALGSNVTAGVLIINLWG